MTDLHLIIVDSSVPLVTPTMSRDNRFINFPFSPSIHALLNMDLRHTQLQFRLRPPPGGGDEAVFVAEGDDFLASLGIGVASTDYDPLSVGDGFSYELNGRALPVMPLLQALSAMKKPPARIFVQYTDTEGPKTYMYSAASKRCDVLSVEEAMEAGKPVTRPNTTTAKAFYMATEKAMPELPAHMRPVVVIPSGRINKKTEREVLEKARAVKAAGGAVYAVCDTDESAFKFVASKMKSGPVLNEGVCDLQKRLLNEGARVELMTGRIYGTTASDMTGPTSFFEVRRVLRDRIGVSVEHLVLPGYLAFCSRRSEKTAANPLGYERQLKASRCEALVTNTGSPWRSDVGLRHALEHDKRVLVVISDDDPHEIAACAAINKRRHNEGLSGLELVGVPVSAVDTLDRRALSGMRQKILVSPLPVIVEEVDAERYAAEMKYEEWVVLPEGSALVDSATSAGSPGSVASPAAPSPQRTASPARFLGGRGVPSGVAAGAPKDPEPLSEPSLSRR
jgi:hypothetical protein